MERFECLILLPPAFLTAASFEEQPEWKRAALAFVGGCIQSERPEQDRDGSRDEASHSKGAPADTDRARLPPACNSPRSHIRSRSLPKPHKPSPKTARPLDPTPPTPQVPSQHHHPRLLCLPLHGQRAQGAAARGQGGLRHHGLDGCTAAQAAGGRAGAVAASGVCSRPRPLARAYTYLLAVVSA